MPITIDLDVARDGGNLKIKDRFLWNVNGKSTEKLC